MTPTALSFADWPSRGPLATDTTAIFAATAASPLHGVHVLFGGYTPTATTGAASPAYFLLDGRRDNDQEAVVIVTTVNLGSAGSPWVLRSTFPVPIATPRLLIVDDQEPVTLPGIYPADVSRRELVVLAGPGITAINYIALIGFVPQRATGRVTLNDGFGLLAANSSAPLRLDAYVGKTLVASYAYGCDRVDDRKRSPLPLTLVLPTRAPAPQGLPTCR